LQTLELGEALVLGGEQRAPRGGAQWPAVVEMLEARVGRVGIAELDREFAFLQRLSVGMRQRADMHAIGPLRGNSDVEVIRVVAERSVRQHVVPPGIVLRRGHVVRHDVEQDPQMVRLGAFDEALPGSLAAQLIADPARVRHIVSMLAAGCRLQARRQVHMAHAQLREIRQNQARRIEREPRVQLQAVAADPFSAHG
jgi:hypothetical protein